MRQYPLLCGDIEAGSVSIVQEGLYYRIVCTCNQEHLYDCCITVETGKTSIYLGKCSKELNGYVLRRFMPIKTLGEGELFFRLCNGSEQKNVVTLDSAQPFPEIALLPHSRFSAEKHGIAIGDKT